MKIIGSNYMDFNLLSGEKKTITDNMNAGRETIIRDGLHVYQFNASGIVTKHGSAHANDIESIVNSYTRKLEIKESMQDERATKVQSFDPVKEALHIGMNFTEVQCANAGARQKVELRMKEGLPSVIVTDTGICEVSAAGIVTNIHKTNDPTERNEIITRITNASGNNKNLPSVPEGQYYMYAHVLERVKDRFPHTKTWGIAAMTKYTIKQFCDSKAFFYTTNGERYVIKGKMTFVVNLKGVIVTVITTTKDFLLYAECFRHSGERIPSWLLSKKALVEREDIVIRFSRN